MRLNTNESLEKLKEMQAKLIRLLKQTTTPIYTNSYQHSSPHFEPIAMQYCRLLATYLIAVISRTNFAFNTNAKWHGAQL